MSIYFYIYQIKYFIFTFAPIIIKSVNIEPIHCSILTPNLNFGTKCSNEDLCSIIHSRTKFWFTFEAVTYLKFLLVGFITISIYV